MRRLLFHPLAWLTDTALADAMLGDLEELRTRARRRSAWRATLWFWRSAAALISYALVARLREGVGSFLESLGGSRGAGGDLRHAARTLRRNPGFAAAAILLLALGIGANTAVFSVVHGVLLRPLPYERPEEVVFVWGTTRTGPGNKHSVLTGTHVQEIARTQTTLESVAPFESWSTGLAAAVDLIADDNTHRLRGARVTTNFFELLGVHAAAGRLFTSTDSDAVPIAVISHRLWKSRFGGAADIVGSEISIADGHQSRRRRSVTIVGVLPVEFRFSYPEETEIYVPLPWTSIDRDGALLYGMIARLRPGGSASHAQAELKAIQHNVLRSYALPANRIDAIMKRESMMVEPVWDHLVAEVRPGVTLLAAVAALVLVIACVNIGLLMVSRTIDRTGELAVRAALGAGRLRLVRLLLVEGVALAAFGGAAGIGIAYTVGPAVRALMPAVVPRIEEIGIDGRVLMFALAATAATAVVCALTPALIVMRRDLFGTVRRAGITATPDRGVAALRMTIVGVQVAIVLVLLVGAGLLLHSFWNLQRVQLGFDAADVLTVEMRLLNPQYRQPGRLAAFQEDLLARVRQLRGVQAAGISTAVPMRGVDFVSNLETRVGRYVSGNRRVVDPTYFEIMRVPLVGGRLFSAADDASAPPVVVVSESYGRAHFGRDNPVGRRLLDDGKEVEIVGVVGDVRHADVSREAGRAFYRPRAQEPVHLICLLVRTQPGTRAEVANSLRDVVRAIDPEQPVQGLTTIGELVSQSTADRRFYAVSTGAFAGVALLLAIAGLFGVVSRSVSERRREIAIRVALGADAKMVLRLVLAFGLLPVALGCLAGLLAAQLGATWMQAFLFEITPADPLTYATAAGTVLGVAVAACLVPGLRAVRLPPMAVLKNE